MPSPIFQDPRFDALRNAIYHTARGRFLDSLNRLLYFAVIVLGAAAVGRVAVRYQFGQHWIELSIVLIATGQLVFDFSGRASTHIFLQKRYYDLLAEMETAPDIDTDEARGKWSARLLTIAGDEPLPLRALDALAYNAALDALINDPKELRTYRLHVPWWQRRFRHIIAFQGTQFVPKSSYRGVLSRSLSYLTRLLRRQDNG